LAALFTTAARLVATQWDDHLNMVSLLTFLGALAGLALGQSIFSARQSAAFAFAYGLFAILWRLGLTLGEGVLWTERLTSLGGRLIVGLDQLARREVVEDPLFFLFLMTSLFWVLSVHAGYNLTRHARPWHIILPSGITLLNIQISDPFVASRVWFMAGYLFFSVLLLARLTYLHHYARWQRDHVLLPLYIGFDLTRVALTITVLLVLVAWTMPAMVGVLPSAEEAWQRVTQPWTIVSDRLNEAFAHLRRTSGLVEYYAYYGGRLSLGRGSELADTSIMTVETPPRSTVNPRYYWRARVYDYYANGQWASTHSATQSVTPTSDQISFAPAEERSRATFTFNPDIPIVTLYAASQPVWVSRPAEVDLAYNPDGTADPSAFHATQPLRAGETYEAKSFLSTATIAQLSAAGTDYPEWVTDRYLRVPSSITPRTLELARQIAGGLDNPYDITAAVTTYLRTHIQYIETVPAPPAGQESLDWFLFDHREGFCNYYASAEIILLRSLGIPARLAVGFARGERQEGQDKDEGDIYLVRHRDAHAWPEVYFPSLGWIEFEPTASQSPVYRPSGESRPNMALPPPAPYGEGAEMGLGNRLDRIRDAESDPGVEIAPDAAQDFRRAVLPWILLFSLGLTLVLLACRLHRRSGLPPLPILLETGWRRLWLVDPPPALRRWARRVALAPLERAYLELDYALARLDAPPAPADTPAERAAALAHLLPPTADPAQQLLAEYQATIYSPRPGNLHIAQQAARAIRDLSWTGQELRSGPCESISAGWTGITRGDSHLL
jgi:transglutaminase-like putative cysteine protease